MTASRSAVIVEDLRIVIERDGTPIVHGASFELAAGEVLGLVGESGSGKSTLGLALLGFAKPGARIVGGRIMIDGTDILTLRPADLRSIRGAEVAYVPQDPGASLNPRLSIGAQLRETMGKGPQSDARIRGILAEVGLPGDSEFLQRHPEQLSGGQQQRVAIAMAIGPNPRLLVLDEPTTGLDVTTQRMVLDTVSRVTEAHRMAAIYISHDLAVIEHVADKVAVMQAGHLVESGAREEVLARPGHDYTQKLLAAVPSLHGPSLRGAGPERDDSPSVFAVEGLNVSHGHNQVLFDVGFRVGRGECVAVVGESGSGKTTLSRTLIGLHTADSGSMRLASRELAGRVAKRSREDRRQMQYIFQNPYASLQPRRSIRDTLTLPLRALQISTGSSADAAVRSALDRVRLLPDVADKFPAELSGGQRQRVAIARALICEPTFLICDEITSALDVSVQASVLELLAELMDDGLSMLFVTHNLAVVNAIATRTLVVQRGRIVEEGPTRTVLAEPAHAYTQRLMADTLDVGSAARGADAQGLSARA
jgi:peptide/nickel transport system ATP-binding protein